MRWLSNLLLIVAALLVGAWNLETARGDDGRTEREQTQHASPATVSKGLFPFFLPADNITEGVTDLSFLNDRPAEIPITVRDGHFYAGTKRIRFWTALLLAGSAFPSHDDAELVARRLASRGFNQVRIHLIDGSYAPNGIFDPEREGELCILPSQLEKLDYLVAQLKQRGLYVELPVHGYHWRNISGKKDYSGMDRAKFSAFSSGVPLWSERFLAAEQQFAREFLGHVNPYTGTSYAEEPAVALIEVINENGILCAWRGNHFRKAWPEEMVADLQSHWNRFLRSRYGSSERLRQRWAEGEIMPDKVEMLRDTEFAEAAKEWYLQVVKPSEATMRTAADDGPEGQSCVTLNSNRATAKSAFVLLQQAGLTIEEGCQYRLSFWAKAEVAAEESERLGVSVSMNHAPWSNVGMSSTAAVGAEWQEHTFFFEGTVDEADAKLLLSPPAGASRLRLTGFSLRKAEIVGLPPGESLEAATVTMPLTPSDCLRRTRTVAVDFVDFLYEVDQRFFTAIRNFLRQELNCRQPIKGTQVDQYSSYFTQAQFDFLDSHGYWQHPRFPRKPWDRKDWTIGNLPMVNAGGETAVLLAGRRVLGKPYNVSEYCHPAPNTFCGEQIPTVTAFAAFQDWDGIGLHCWRESIYDWRLRAMRKLDPDRLDSYFNIARHPVKLVTVPFGALAFRRGDVSPARQELAIGVTLEEEKNWLVEQPRQAQWWQPFQVASRKGATWRDAFTHRIGLELGSDHVPAFVFSDVHRVVSDTGELVYDLTDPSAGTLTVNSSLAKAMIGFGSGKVFELGDVLFEPGPTLQDGFSVITAAAVHGDNFHDSGASILVTATGYVENQGMGWNADKTSVGDQWGEGPVLCEGIPFEMTLKTPHAKAWALDGHGRRAAPVPAEQTASGTRFVFGPRYKTLWYEVEVE